VNGKYVVQSVLASGGMGRIYLAEQQPLGRQVALKVLHPRSTGSTVSSASGEDLNFKKRFLREANILARLQHPNIVTVYDYGRVDPTLVPDEQYFMAMEYLQGETLHARIDRQKRLTPAETVHIGKHICRGLREAHAQGVVHRDLKPSNLMIVTDRDGDDLVKILDFGIVKLMADEADQELTQEGNFLGSPKYMAPEQITDGKIDARADVYALGAILYHCLTGHAPFEHETTVRTLMAQVNEAPLPARDRAPEADIPEWLDTLILRCLAKSKEDRPQSVGELSRCLSDGLALLPEGTTSSLLRATGGSLPMSQVAPSSGKGSHSGARSRGSEPTRGSPSGGTLSSSRAGADGGFLQSHVPHDLRTTNSTLQSGTFSASPPSPNGRLKSVVLLGAVFALLVGVGVTMSLRSSSSATAAAASAPSAETPAGVKPERRAFVVYVDSVPTAADVFDGETLLGKTPLQLSLDNAAVHGAPKRIVVKKEGYQAYSVLQGPSDDNVRITATLAPDEAVAAGSDRPMRRPAPPQPVPQPAPQPAPRRPTASPQTTQTQPPAAPQDNDIRLRR
jgi:serine/threonine-protein kinase